MYIAQEQCCLHVWSVTLYSRVRWFTCLPACNSDLKIGSNNFLKIFELTTFWVKHFKANLKPGEIMFRKKTNKKTKQNIHNSCLFPNQAK